MLAAQPHRRDAERQRHPARGPRSPEAAPRIRELEVQDDDDDVDAVEAAAVSSVAAAPAGVAAAAEDDAEAGCRVAWDSSSRRRPGAPAAGDALPPGRHDDPPSADFTAAGHLKDQGNALFRRGDAAGALAAYTQALDLAAGGRCGGTGITPQIAGTLPAATRTLLGTLHSNASAAALRLGRPADAAAAALRARALRPGWPKPLHRLAEAQLAAGNFAAAVAACRAGERGLLAVSSEGRTEFSPLLDRLAVAAAAAGSLAGFDGRDLEVRPAGEEAWLGRPAPHVPALDGPLDEDSALPSDDLTIAPPTPALAAAPAPAGAAGRALAVAAAAAATPAGDALAGWDYRADARALAARQRTSFRCLREALGAARDGDRVLLRRGVHNGLGEAVAVGRRVLIQGEGALGEASIDQRANCPTFRITRGGVVLRNIDLDQTGFREAVLVAGSADVAPLLDGCTIRCSGDDAVNVSGGAAPVLRRCTLAAKKCGLRAFDAARPRLEGCAVEGCGEQGVKAMDTSLVVLNHCKISGCAEEGVVVMGGAAAELTGCLVTGNKGPGVDASGAGRVAVTGGAIEGNVGGVWLWGSATARLEGARVEGGPCQVLLADGGAAAVARGCAFEGTVHAGEGAWRGLAGGGNMFADPGAPTDFPPEEGPFRFVPNRFRKQ